MPRQDVLIYGYFETPVWPDPPGHATAEPVPVAATASIPSPVVSAPIGVNVAVDAEVFVGVLIDQPSIAGIVSVAVDTIFVPVMAEVLIDDPVVDVSGGGAAATSVDAVASVPAPTVSISGTGATFGGNFGGTF